MEIERKFLPDRIPSDLDSYPKREIEQGYLCVSPVVRVRRDDLKYELTYKSGGMMKRQEYNLPLTKEAYDHLKEKVDGRLITKTRYMIPYENHTIELDVFGGDLKPLIIAEVEFESERAANEFTPPKWFGREVTYLKEYHNSTLSQL